MPEFKLIDRGFKDTLALIPGWAADHRIFEPLELDYNYLLPVDFRASDLKESLVKFMDGAGIKNISLLGWSMGGFLAADLAAEKPELVNELILVSIRRKYEPKALEKIKELLKKNKRAYLYSFYLECFSCGDKKPFNWFKKSLLRDYVNSMELEGLLDGLDYLSQARIECGALKDLRKVRIFHGEEDAIAPFSQAREVKDGFAQARFVGIEGAGHIPFLNSDFREKFYNG